MAESRLVAFRVVDVQVIFDLDLGSFPREEGHILAAVVEDDLVLRQLPPEDLGLPLEQADPHEVLDLVDSELLLGLELEDLGLLEPYPLMQD